MIQKQSIFYDDLKALADEKYLKFTSKLTPNIEAKRFLGVRVPLIRTLVGDLYEKKPKEIATFLADLPHYYYDENNLHSLIISAQKDFNQAIHSLEAFLPHVDNWATCDIMRPKIFKKHKNDLLPHIQRWLNTEHEYTIRFAILMLMNHFLEDAFKPEYLAWVANVKNESYYVKMMVAWFFATALSKQYHASLSILKDNKLNLWTHNRIIKKACESRRILPEAKENLKALKRK